MDAVSSQPIFPKAIRAHAHAGRLNCAKRFKDRSKVVSHLERHSKPGKRLLKRLLRSKVAQGRFYGPDATPHDLGDNPIRSEFNTTLENGQRTQLEETFTFDHDSNPATPDVAKATTYDWVYDANDRLLSETIDHHDDALDRTESFVMDLFGNRTNRKIDYVDPTAVDQAFAYSYDDNDRLTSETLDENADGSINQTTQYSWDITQQSAKETFTGDSTAPANLVSSQTFAYDLQGRLAEVITSPETGPATKVTYSYDSSGIRVSSSQFTDANTNGVFETSELDHTIDYLVDHRNHSGYAQTIAETTTAGSGDNVSRVTTTFGTDELSQTTYTPDPATADAWLAEAMHFFGHDAHGSVRVLLDALGEIAQTFTYAAYGELLAIYDSTGTLVGTLGAADTTAALTNLLYSGESFDSRIGQQYLRARWYNTQAARFSRLDPYFGTLNDPLSFNKFNYVHSNPILGSDPTGLYTASTQMTSIGIQSRGRSWKIAASAKVKYKVVDFAVKEGARRLALQQLGLAVAVAPSYAAFWLSLIVNANQDQRRQEFKHRLAAQAYVNYQTHPSVPDYRNFAGITTRHELQQAVPSFCRAVPSGFQLFLQQVTGSDGKSYIYPYFGFQQQNANWHRIMSEAIDHEHSRTIFAATRLNTALPMNAGGTKTSRAYASFLQRNYAGMTGGHVIPKGIGGPGVFGNMFPQTPNANQIVEEGHESRMFGVFEHSRSLGGLSHQCFARAVNYHPGGKYHNARESISAYLASSASTTEYAGSWVTPNR